MTTENNILILVFVSTTKFHRHVPMNTFLWIDHLQPWWLWLSWLTTMKKILILYQMQYPCVTPFLLLHRVKIIKNFIRKLNYVGNISVSFHLEMSFEGLNCVCKIYDIFLIQDQHFSHEKITLQIFQKNAYEWDYICMSSVSQKTKSL